MKEPVEALDLITTIGDVCIKKDFNHVVITKTAHVRPTYTIKAPGVLAFIDRATMEDLHKALTIHLEDIKEIENANS